LLLREQVRTIAGDLVEEVKLIDNFTHPKTVGAPSLIMACKPAGRVMVASQGCHPWLGAQVVVVGQLQPDIGSGGSFLLVILE